MKVYLAIHDKAILMYRVTYVRRRKIKGKYYKTKYVTYKRVVEKGWWWNK